MKALILAAYLVGSLVFAWPGSPQYKSPDNVQKKSENNNSQSKPLPPSVVQANAPPKAQTPSSNIAAENIEHRIRIGTPVSVKSIKDRWDKGLVILTGAVVAVGIFQIIFLWRTVRATSKNASAAKEGAEAAKANAEAAKRSADALINMERGWLLLDGIAPKRFLTDIYQLRAQNKPVMVTVIFKNFGRTPAWLIEASLNLTCESSSSRKFPEIPEYRSAYILPNSELVPPEHMATPRGLELRQLTDEEIQGIKVGKQILLVYGFIRYRDVFFEQIGKLRETYFCRRLISLGPEGEHWMDYGPKGANHNT